MATESDLSSDVPSVIRRMTGRPCPWCRTPLVYDRFHGNDASFCPDCETPIVQLF